MSRSQEKRIAAMKGEPPPQFDLRPVDMLCVFCQNHTPGPSGFGITHHTFHCKSRSCIEACEECADDFIAITEECPWQTKTSSK